MTATATLAPHGGARWDMTPYFPEFDGPEYRAFRDAYRARIAELVERARSIGPLDGSSLAGWARLLADSEELGVRGGHLASYLGCVSAADSKNEAIQREYAGLQALYAEQQKIGVAVRAAFKSASQADFERLVARPELAGAEYALVRLREEARQTMSAVEEELAAELGVDGFHAWGRLHDQISGRLEFEMPDPAGGTRRVPMAMKVSLLEHQDPAVRKAALENSNLAWAAMEEALAAALNSIAGTRRLLYRRRGIAHFLDQALFESAISRATLEAMMGAVERGFETPRRFLRLKARLLGKERLGFQDLQAPLPLAAERAVPWDEARERLRAVFDRRYPDLAGFAELAFRDRWVDSEPRAGRRPGGFCSSSRLIQQSRVFMTYNGTLGCVQTLAHELGHAWHNWVMRGLRPYQRGYPMTLAESASTFAETLLTDALLEDPAAPPEEKAVVLNTRLSDAGAFLLNIPMRFRFESALYEERERGVVPVSRLKELVLEAERWAYGDSLAEDELDPYFWASKLHFYITYVSFYNFPYTFGYLFSLGLMARYKQEGAAFLPRYEALLRLTGSDTAENVARRAIGVDLERPDYWEESLDLVAADLARFEALAPPLVAAGR